MRDIMSPLDGVISPLRRRSGFSPRSLFAAGEAGAWYDPSDFSTMFQDAAGTTPVTAVEQPVGLILDKSKGLAVGAELVSNGDFASGTTGWTNASVGTGTFAATGGIATLTGTDANNRGALRQAITCVVGRTYKVICDVAGGSLNVAVGSATTLDGTGGVAVTSTGAVTFVVVASATTMYCKAWNIAAGGTVTIDNISVKEIAGNHASQSTSASRPVLSARYNLLTYTEQFDNAAWGKVNTTVTANYATAPDGTTTADRVVYVGGLGSPATRLIQQGPTLSSTANLTLTFGIWVSGTGKFRLKNSQGGVKDNYTSDYTATSTPTWYTLTVTNGASAGNGAQFVGIVGATTDDAFDLNVWGADLRVTNDGIGLPAYQRVVDSTTYDAGDQWPKYLRFDGTDDSLATSSIDFSGTDKMTVFAGVRKLSDAARGMVVELSTTWGSANPGSFMLWAGADGSSVVGAYYTSGATGTTTGSASLAATASGYAAPITNIVSAKHSISDDSSVIRVNGAEIGSATGDKGTGNFGNYPLYIGRRGTSTLPYNGRLYSLIVRGAASSDTQIASAEKWVNGKTGAY